MQHIEGLIKKQIRIDSRQLNEYREVCFTCRSPGSVEVHIGTSKALGECEITAVEAPYADFDRGDFKLNVNFLPMANPTFRDAKGPRDLVEIAKVVERTLISTRAIDLEGLVILKGKLIWRVVVCVNIINDSGNLMDLVSTTAVSTLLSSVKREVQICGTDVKILTPEERVPLPFVLHHIPITITFGITDSGTPLIDPTDREESVCNCKLTFAINRDGEVCAVQKSGSSIPMKTIQQCSQIASEKAQSMIDFITEEVKKSKEKNQKK
ncbi:Exosome complex exonuclease RRP45 [Entamoeba marina]